MGFVLISVCVLVVLFSPPARAAGPLPLPLPPPDPVPGGQQERLVPPYLQLPVFRHFRRWRFNKQHFSPAQVKSREPLPERVRQILVPAPRRHPETRMSASGPVSVACTARKMRVRVHAASLGASGERVHVTLGTCGSSGTTERSVLFHYRLQECGTRRQVINKTVVYSNMLHYTTEVPGSGSEMFSVPVQCHFNTFHYSYKIGFMPSVEALKIYKPMRTRGSVTLTACDAQWNRLSPGEGFIIGQPMYFEAETLYVPDDKRLFVHFCHVTMNSSHVSTPQVQIIDNYGCLISSDSGSRSRFINSTGRNVVRFTVDAFTLRGKLRKYLFMHCEMSIKSVVPTETSKSCTYNHLERRWEELYGADAVCSCCNSSCDREMPTVMQPVKSDLEASGKPHPGARGRKNPTQSPEETATPEPEHEALVTESQLEIISESTPAPVHEHGDITPEPTPTPENEREVLSAERARVEIVLERPPPTGSERVVPTPESERVQITDTSTQTLEDGHRIPAPENQLVPMMPEGKYGTLMLDSKHEDVAPEAPPPSPDSVGGTPMPDAYNQKVTPYSQETVSPHTLTTSVKPNTHPPLHTHTPLQEPYRVFEEVFGLG